VGRARRRPATRGSTCPAPLSADFTIAKPALVQAFALVENGGDQSIIQWSQAVELREPKHHGGDAEAHDEHEH
jgi:hypothetical protein